MFNKKAQGLSLNVIVIAALVLLVLVILALIFLGRLSTTSQEIAQCENKGGTCQDGSPQTGAADCGETATPIDELGVTPLGQGGLLTSIIQQKNIAQCERKTAPPIICRRLACFPNHGIGRKSSPADDVEVVYVPLG